MTRDPYFVPADEALRIALDRLRADPPGRLSGLAPLVAQLEQEPGSQKVASLLGELAERPLSYLPEIDPNPADLMVTVVRGLRLLLSLAESLPVLDDEARLALLRALYDHAEHLYCFDVTRHGHVRLLNGAFLVLAGFYLDGFPVSEHWRLAGMTRLLSGVEPVGSALEQPGVQAAIDLMGPRLQEYLTHLRDEPLGTLVTEIVLWVAQRARLAGLSLIPHWAEYYHHITGQSLKHSVWTGMRVMSDAGFWQSLDLERPELAAVRSALERGDEAAARHAYVQHVARLATLREAFYAGRDIAVDMTEADEVCEDIFTLHAHMHHRHVFTDGIDWTMVLFRDLESNVSLNYHHHAYLLSLAFYHTRDDKYLHHLIRVLRSWLDASPMPDRWQPLLQWRTLEVGNRSGQMWPMILLAAADQPRFQNEMLFDMARSYLEHGRYLLAHQAVFGNNWFQVETGGLAVTALLFPEFRESERFWHCAMRRLAWINQVCFLPDGFQSECSTGYHWFPVKGMTVLYELAVRLGHELPDGFAASVERMLGMYVNVAQPDLNAPRLNDCSPAQLPVTGPLRLATKLFPEGEGFRYLATRRAQGQPPAHTSCAFPHAGYYISRDGWGADAFYTIFDAGYYGLGHQHEDKLNFVLHAHGRTLIDDPSIYQYKRDEFEPYWRGSRGHNAILVDGKGQNRRLRDEPEPRPDPDTVWITGQHVDFGQGWYRDGFAARTGDVEADRALLDRSIQHARTLLVVKGEYAVLVDWVLGAGEHTVEQVFHLAPIVERQAPDGVRAGALAELCGGIVRSVEPDLANVALIPVSSEPLGVRIESGQLGPVRGWSALYGKQPAHDVTYTVRRELPVVLPVVLWPQAVGQSALPQVAPVAVEADGANVVALQIADGRGDDLLILSRQAAQVRWSGGVFHGQALWVRRDASGTVRQTVAVVATHLTLEGDVVLSSDRPIELYEERGGHSE